MKGGKERVKTEGRGDGWMKETGGMDGERKKIYGWKDEGKWRERWTEGKMHGQRKDGWMKGRKKEQNGGEDGWMKGNTDEQRKGRSENGGKEIWTDKGEWREGGTNGKING